MLFIVGTYCIRHMEFRKADESFVCSDKASQFLQTSIIISYYRILTMVYNFQKY
jgi:hypothetical protein